MCVQVLVVVVVFIVVIVRSTMSATNTCMTQINNLSKCTDSFCLSSILLFSDALTRQIAEAVNINNTGDIIHNKGEWNSHGLTRIQLTTDFPASQDPAKTSESRRGPDGRNVLSQ